MSRVSRQKGFRSAVAAAAVGLALVGGPLSQLALAAPAHAAETVRQDDPVCVGSDRATMSAVFDAVLQASKPILPQPYLDNYEGIRAEGQARLRSVGISTLSVSNPASVYSSDDEAGIHKYGDPITQYIITQLMNVKAGREGAVIRAENLTLGQAIETAYAVIYTTAVIPANIVAGMIPSMFAVGPVSAGTLISLPLRLGAKGFTAIYEAARDQLEKSCVVWTTKAVADRAGQPDQELDYGFRAPAFVEAVANELDIAGPDCLAVSGMPLSRVLSRTTSHLTSLEADPARRAQIEDQRSRLEWIMGNAMVPANLIPAHPDDFSSIEKFLSMGLGLVPKVGGAATDALIGLGHNVFAGKDFSKLVPLGTLTVGDSLTAAYFSYALTSQVMELVFDESMNAMSAAWTGASAGVGALVNPFEWIPSPFPLINAPNVYGLVTYHHVLNSVCLTSEADK